MGFMDKAKKMAEQAQAKLDEAQKQFNQGSGSQPPAGGGPAVEYDKHGRPIPSQPPETATPPHGDPVGTPAASAPPPPPPAPTPDPAAPPPPPQASAPPPPPAPPAPPQAPAPPAPPTGDQPADEDPNRPSYAPPKMTSGDPLG